MAETKEINRTQEQIDNVLLRSKLKSEDMLPITQCVSAKMENFSDGNYRLLELDAELYEALKCGDTIAFKGIGDEDVMLCTETRTYDIRECETSNSLVLVSNLAFFTQLSNIKVRKIINVPVQGINYKYMEVLPCEPPLKKVLTLLEDTKYNGPENEYKIDVRKLLTFDELSDKIQASTRELRVFLVAAKTIVLEEKVRLLDVNYLFRVVSYMLQSVDEFDAVNKKETISTWKEIIPEVILENVFDFYTEKTKVLSGIQLYKYKEFDVCRLIATILLNHSSKFNLDEFMQVWSDSVPDGMTPHESMLNGISIIDRTTLPNTIMTFTEHNLPSTLNERLKHLFEIKTKWTSAEITPYIKCFTTDKLDANAILAKYARATTTANERYYSAKYI